MSDWAVPLIVCSLVAIFSFIIGYYEGKESSDVNLKAQEEIIDIKFHNIVLASKIKRLNRSNGQLQRRPKA